MRSQFYSIYILLIIKSLVTKLLTSPDIFNKNIKISNFITHGNYWIIKNKIKKTLLFRLIQSKPVKMEKVNSAVKTLLKSVSVKKKKNLWDG